MAATLGIGLVQVCNAENNTVVFECKTEAEDTSMDTSGMQLVETRKRGRNGSGVEGNAGKKPLLPSMRDEVENNGVEINAGSSATSGIPPVVYIKARSGDLTTLNPAIVRKEITDQFSPVEKIEKCKQSLRIFCKTENQKKSILKTCRVIAGLRVEVSEPRAKNRPEAGYNFQSARKPLTRVVVLGVPADMTEEVKLASGAGTATRMTKWCDGQRVDTTGVILTFSEGVDIPEMFEIDYLKFKTRPYIANPMRCHRCQLFGHKSTNCRAKKEVCPRCGGGHNFDACTTPNELKCANCGEAHSADSRECAKYVEVKKALKRSATKKISYRDAVLQVRAEEAATEQSATKQMNADHTETLSVAPVVLVGTSGAAQSSQNANITNTQHTDTRRFNDLDGPGRPVRTANRSNAARPVDSHGATTLHAKTQTQHDTPIQALDQTAAGSRDPSSLTAAHVTTDTNTTSVAALRSTEVVGGMNTGETTTEQTVAAIEQLNSISVEQIAELFVKICALFSTNSTTDKMTEAMKLVSDTLHVSADLIARKQSERQLTH